MTWVLPDPGRRAGRCLGCSPPWPATTTCRRTASSSPTTARTSPRPPCGRRRSSGGRRGWRSCACCRRSRAFGSQYRRGQQLDVMMKRHHPEEPHWYLAVIGSDPTYRGGGYGKALMGPDWPARTPGSPGVPGIQQSRQRAVLRAVRVRGRRRVGAADDGPTMWAMWRHNRAERSAPGVLGAQPGATASNRVRSRMAPSRRMPSSGTSGTRSSRTQLGRPS